MAKDIRVLGNYVFRLLDRRGRDDRPHIEIGVYELVETQEGLELYHIKPLDYIQLEDKDNSDLIKKLAKLIRPELEAMVLKQKI